MFKGKKGITLVALVVTIVVLLILAGVSINLVLGDNGIISKARTTARNKLLTKFVYKYAFLSKESHQCILTSDLEHDIIESI